MHEELDKRIDAWLQGNASDEDVRELDLVLRRSEEARIRLLMAASLEMELARFPAVGTDANGEGIVAASHGHRKVRWPGRRGILAAMTAAAAALALIVWTGLHFARPPWPDATLVARVTDVSGVAERVIDGNRCAPLAKTAAVLPGEEVRTDAGAQLVLTYADGSRIALAANTRLGLTRESDHKGLNLKAGALTADVRPQPEGHAMVVITPQAMATVVGTRFHLAADADLSRLDVEEGRVEVTRRGDGDRVTVAAGQYTIVRPGIVLRSTDGRMNWTLAPAAAGGNASKAAAATTASQAAAVAASTTTAPVAATALPPAHAAPINGDDPLAQSAAVAPAGYDANVPYVDGELLFADDFESGFGKWEVVTTDTHGARVPVQDPDAFVSPIRVKHFGEPTTAVAIRADDRQHKRVGLRLRTPVSAPAFSLTFEYTLAQGRGAYNPIGLELDPQCLNRTVYWNTASQTLLQRGEWMRVRMEFVRFRDANGRDIVDMKWYQNGVLGVRTYFVSSTANILLETVEGLICFDDVVVKEMTPVK